MAQTVRCMLLMFEERSSRKKCGGICAGPYSVFYGTPRKVER